MFDEDEFTRLSGLYDEGAALLGRYAIDGRTPEPERVAELFTPLQDEYERLTGTRQAHPKTFLHHRLGNYGPPCCTCGKPLRTPQASKCMECGTPRIGCPGGAANC
jgi:hypothetical protein